ncbi:hypothetical protein APHAL10511_007590 [Amanita phalloides]|nr:hypothetical protein APHAL10511_007590 [Amanita phalloides]
MFKLFGALTAALVAVSYASPTGTLGGLLQARSASISSGCGTAGTPSCTNTTQISNLCCFEYPGGLILLTQFWDTNPTTGPDNSWTIHGLWPDHCDGTFSQNCDSSRDYTNISGLLTSQGASSTLSFMETYWVNNAGTSEALWEHEWATHGTCYSTLKRSCLPPGSPTGAEAVAFFETVVGLFQTYDIYTSLQNAGITPSTTVTYSHAQLQNAIVATYGVIPAFFCSSGVLDQVYIYFHLQGSVIDGQFDPINVPSFVSSGSCPSTGIKYPPK